MIKGISRHVIVVNSPDPALFEKAFFIVRDDAFLKKGVSSEDILKEAQKVAGDYVSSNLKRRRFHLPAPVYAAAGAAFTGIAWLCARLIM